jgi:hypothetical protein
LIQTLPLGMIWMPIYLLHNNYNLNIEILVYNCLLNNNYNLNIEILVYNCFGCPHIYWSMRRYYTIQLIY